jgi:hypothetical protein
MIGVGRCTIRRVAIADAAVRLGRQVPDLLARLTADCPKQRSFSIHNRCRAVTSGGPGKAGAVGDKRGHARSLTATARRCRAIHGARVRWAVSPARRFIQRERAKDLERAGGGIMRNLPRWATAVLLGTVPLPGWGLLLLAIVMGIPDWKSRYDFWLSVAESSAPWFGPIIPVLRYPYFPAALAIAGIVYLILVGYPGPSVVRHRVVPLVAWVLLTLSATIVAGTAIAGYFEFRVREEADKLVLNIPRSSSPKENDASQRPLSFEQRDLQPNQIRILAKELPNLKTSMPQLHIALAPNDAQARNLYSELQPIIYRSGMIPVMVDFPPRGPEDQGQIILVHDKNKVPDAASKLMQVLTIADIPTQYSTAEAAIRDPDFIFFIAPTPFN